MAIPRNFEFFVIKVHYEKLGHMLKPLVPKFYSDLYIRLRDIADKQASAKLKPIEVCPRSDVIISALLFVCFGISHCCWEEEFAVIGVTFDRLHLSSKLLNICSK